MLPVPDLASNNFFVSLKKRLEWNKFASEIKVLDPYLRGNRNTGAWGKAIKSNIVLLSNTV